MVNRFGHKSAAKCLHGAALTTPGLQRRSADMATPTTARTTWIARYVLPHEPALRAWVRSRRVENIETEDVVQETYAILAALPHVGHITNPKAYMITTARSVILQHLRRSRVISMTAMADMDHLGIQFDEPSAERQVAARQELRLVAEQIATLPARCRQAFILRKVEGLSQKEIAQRMGVTENTVEKQIATALRTLIRKLAHSEPQIVPTAAHTDCTSDAKAPD